jgi:hypothetical protein
MLNMKKVAQILLVALIVVLLIMTFVLVTFANVLTQHFNELSVPVELNTALPGVTGYDVHLLDDGGLVLNSANQTGTYLTKLTLDNQILWTQQIYAGPESLTRLVVLSQGDFLLAGIVNNLYVLVKTDIAGNVEWNKTFDSGANVNYLMDIVESDDNGFVWAGFGEPQMDGLGWIWFSKTDGSGKLQWSQNISGPTSDCPSHIIKTADGGYVLSDTAYSFVPDQAFFRLIRLDAEGHVLGNTSYGGYGYYYQPECNSVIATDDGGYLMLGYLWRKEAWIVKVDADGEMQWNQTYSESRCAITGALQTPNGFLLQEYLNGNQTGIILTDKQGNVVWNTTFANVTMPVGMEANFRSLIAAQNGGYIMIASKNNSTWLAKFDYPNAFEVWHWLIVAILLMLSVSYILLYCFIIGNSLIKAQCHPEDLSS